MRILPPWTTGPKKRSYWRGIAAGLLSHYLAVAVLVGALMVIRPFVWAAVYGVPYSPPAGPVDPTSNEGTLLQVLGLLSWVPAGAAALHWSADRSFNGLFTLLAYTAALLMLAFIGESQPPMPLGRAVWYCLSAPLGLAIGAFLYLRRATAQHAAQHSLGRAPGEQ